MRKRKITTSACDNFRRWLWAPAHGRDDSAQKLNAISLAAAPDHFAGLMLRAVAHQCEAELVADVDRDIRHDSRTARRYVEHETFPVGEAVIDRHPGRLLVQLPSQFAHNLRPGLIDGHEKHPVAELSEQQSVRDPVKVLLGYWIGIYRFAAWRCSQPPGRAL
jgi:hypothetical protein